MAKQVGITVGQRTALRRHARGNKKLPQRLLKRWFEEQFQRTITQSTISESLSSKYSHLDQQDVSSSNQDALRGRAAKYPELDKALLQWYCRYKAYGTITGDLLRAQAAKFWQRMPIYRGMEMPTFSNGWLQKFKRRHNISSRPQPGEAASVDVPLGEEQIEQAKSLARQYAPSDIYNCGETGLYWKMLPDRSPPISTYSSDKPVDKERITAHFCCNADGSHKLRPWLIGKTLQPRSFSSAGVHFNALNCVWRANSHAWMISNVFADWLRWFDSQVEGRRVLLFMDDSSAHTAAINRLAASTPLKNTIVVYLPPNSTSVVQPLDQGIIRAFKTHYRTRWIQYMLDEFEADRQPIKTMSLLKAVRWSIQAWQELSPTLIKECFIKSTLVIPNQSSQLVEDDLEASAQARIEEGLRRLQQRQRIHSAMSLQQLLDPEEELVRDDNVDLTELIAVEFDPLQEEHEEEVESIEEIAPIAHVEMLRALALIRSYELQQPDGRHSWIEACDDQEEHVKTRMFRDGDKGPKQSHSSRPHDIHGQTR